MPYMRKTVPSKDSCSGEELRDDISRALVRLPSRQATAVVMRHVLELSYEEIGGALGCSETTARVHVNRACKKLSRLLAHLAPLGFTVYSQNGMNSVYELMITESTK